MGKIFVFFLAIIRYYRQLELNAPNWLIGIFSVFAFIFGNIFHLQFKIFLKTIAPKSYPDLGSGFSSFIQYFDVMNYSAETKGALGATLLPFVFLSLTAIALYRLRYQIFELNIQKKNRQEATPRRIVIMGLSIPTNFDEEKKKHDLLALVEPFSVLSLEEAGNAKLGYFPWQQNLRILYHHLSGSLPTEKGVKHFTYKSIAKLKGTIIPPKKRYIIILPSKEGKHFPISCLGTKYEEKACQKAKKCLTKSKYQDICYADIFQEMAEQCIDNSIQPTTEKPGIPAHRKPEMIIWHTPVDYSDLDSLITELRKIIYYVRVTDKNILARPDEISIDTTAGSKPPSIAAASVTYASPIEFSYLEQGSNDFVAFDVTANLKKKS